MSPLAAVTVAACGLSLYGLGLALIWICAGRAARLEAEAERAPIPSRPALRAEADALRLWGLCLGMCCHVAGLVLFAGGS